MAEDLHITKGDKKAQYESLIPQIKALLEGIDEVFRFL